MGDTVKIIVTKEWVVIPGLVHGKAYALQNVTDKNLYLQQTATPPDNSDTGFKVQPAEVVKIIKEPSDIYIRSLLAGGLAYINEVNL